ncbi:hypothetical protein U9M48_015376 [Paspalum notatum var. saurae]|uniref:AAA+ ATPase domain-containing protein n=1 Tax=Paspalum notatum var. saurae TaxID=547442 RepID=A0AAQ3WLG8_PASNO
MRRVCLGRRRRGDDDGDDGRHVLSMEVGDEMADVFEGIKFTWTSVGDSEGHFRNKAEASALELSFDAEHTDAALQRYVPFVTASVEAARLRDRTLQIFSSQSGLWQGSKYLHPATFDTVAMDPALKRAIVDDLDRFLKRKDYYRRIGKAWKRGYLLYGPPGTGKSSLVAAMANYLRFNIYDLDLSNVHSNCTLQWLLTSMSNKSILIVEDIDCCFSARSRCGPKKSGDQEADGNPADGQDDAPALNQDTFTRTRSKRSLTCLTCGTDILEFHQGQGITLSGLLNFIDGLWSTSGEERIIIFTTNYKERLDPALLRPGRMDMHVYMGCCGWEAFKTLARNYFLVDEHPLFPELQELLSDVEVTPAAVSEMLLRSEDVDVALKGLAKFLDEKKQGKQKGETGKA